MEVSQTLAQQIVDAVYEVVGQDINLIDGSGMVIGSTDHQRIHTYHEAGFQAILQQIPIEVGSDQEYAGTKAGINYPILIDGTAIAAVGISGNPAVMKQFGFLITKITEVFLKEQQLDHQMLSHNRAVYYLVTSLLYHTNLESRQFSNLMAEWSISAVVSYQVLNLKITSPDMEKELNFLFGQLGCHLTAYIYPNEYNAILTELQAQKFWAEKASFVHTYQGKLSAGAGPFTRLYEVFHSYENARLACRHAAKTGSTLCSSDDISMELLIDSIPPDIRRLYLQRNLSSLTIKDKELLMLYYQNSLSLKKAAAKQFIHPNTLQYQLDQIKKKCGRNPRNFQEAVSLYLGLLLDKTDS